MTGTFAGRYTIERELGRGATATVYLARDAHRGRPVAIKLMRAELAQSIGTHRFLREIRLTEQLHHPHIVPVLDSGEHDGSLYFVLPHMEGGSLRQMLTREKQLPLEAAIAIARTVAEALDYAHKQKLIHRDVKPENILFTSGQACLADFGIARALERAMDESTTDSGLVRGTPAYMSPEQASGSKDYDGRSDQYSLACVLYEMLAGVPAFIGPTPEAVIAQRFQHPPRELRVYRPTVPASVETVLLTALSISPADRYATAGAFAEALDSAPRTPTMERRASGPSVGFRKSKAVALVGASLFVTLSVAVAIALKTRLDPPNVFSFVVPPPTGAIFSDNLRDVAAVSPDGKDIVIAGTDSGGTRHLWLRPLRADAATRIPGTELGSKAFWSPDGRSIGFFQNGALAILRLDGSERRTLQRVANDPRGGSWADNGTILYAPSSQSGIQVFTLQDSSSRPLTERSAERGEIGHMWPQALPGGRDFLYFVASAVDSVRGIYLGSTRSLRGRRIVGSSASAVYSNGYLLFVHDGALVAQRLDLGAGSLTGERRIVADSVATSYLYYGAFSASRDGVLVYVGGRSRDISRLVWMDTSGAVRGVASPSGYLRNPSLSASGRHLAYETYRETDSDIRYVDLTSGASSVLPDGGAQAIDPIWSPDGSSLAFIVERPGEWTVYRKRINRSDPADVVFRSPHYTVLTDWSTDGTLVSVERAQEGGDYEVVGRRVATASQARILAGGPGHQVAGRVSPNGKYLAYVSLESGQPQVYAQRLGTTGTRCQLSVSGGFQPVWGRGGDVYFLTSSGTMMRAVVDMRGPAPCPIEPPKALFSTEIRNPSAARSFFDVSARDGQFLVNLPSGDAAWLSVISDWMAAVGLNR